MAEETRDALARLLAGSTLFAKPRGLLDVLSQTWPARAAQTGLEALMLPGQVAGGVMDTKPQTPGMWSDEDEARSQATADTMRSRAGDLAGLLMGGSYAMPPMQNAAGMGIRAYHGSPNSFERFDLSRAGTTTDQGLLGLGHYASTDPRVAAKYAHRYEVDADLKNPLRLSMPDFRTDKAKLAREALGLPPSATSQEITNAARAKGHDGVILDYTPTGYKQQELAVFGDNGIEILRKY
jgi:hypothetical protein